MTADEPIYMIPQAVYDKVADMEGQEAEGYKVHSVDRNAGTLMVGATCFQVAKIIPFERVVFEGIRFHISSSDEMAAQNLTARAMVKPRGAQWKRERSTRRFA